MQIDTGEEEEKTIDLAPLLDCIFLLLIFFMITTSFNTDAKRQLEIPLKLPRVSSGFALETGKPLKALEITIDQKGGLYLNAVESNLSDLHRILKADALISPDRKIVIIGDREVPFDRVAQVMDLCHLLGRKNVSVRAEQRE